MTPITVVIGERTLTGIRTGISSRGFGAQQLSGVAMHGGMIVQADRFTPWPVERLVEHQGELYLCGPLIENARSVVDVIHGVDTGTEDRYVLLETLFESARHAIAHELSLCNVITSAIGSDGAVLYIKRELSDRINANLPLELRRIAHFPYRHDHLHDVDAESYQFAAIAFRVLTGTAICRESDVRKADLCHSAGTAKEPVHLHTPNVSTEAAAAIDAVLAGTGTRDPEGFETLARSLLVGSSRLIDENLPSDERQARREAAEQTLAQWTRSSRRRDFRRRYGSRVILIAAAVLLLGSIPFGILRRALRPPPTAGMAPAEVVAVFFDAWNDLDHILMEETVSRGVARDLIREVTNVYVIERVQTAYGDQGRLLSVEEWNAAGRPENSMPYGIDELTITPIRQTEEEARVIAEYRIWRPEASEGTTILYRTRVRDEITLHAGRQSWEITAIEREIIESLSDPL